MGRRVEEEGASEGRSVMGRIGVAPWQHHPTRKGADFPLVFRHERTLANWLEEASRMSAAATLAGAAPLATGSGPGRVSCRVSAWCRRTASRKGRLPGSSCLRGNVPVQFLGEG